MTPGFSDILTEKKTAHGVCLPPTRGLGARLGRAGCAADQIAEIFAVEFCPYQPLDADPVFAVVSKKHVAICKLSREHILKTGMVKTIKLLRDDDVSEE
jgi:hypothetical protein